MRLTVRFTFFVVVLWFLATQTPIGRIMRSVLFER